MPLESVPLSEVLHPLRETAERLPHARTVRLRGGRADGGDQSRLLHVPVLHPTFHHNDAAMKWDELFSL